MNKSISFWNSIISKFSIFFTGLLILSILFSGYLVYKKSEKKITEYSKEKIEHYATLSEQAFYALLNEVANDIQILSNSERLNHFVQDPNPENTGWIEQEFHNMLSHKPNYFQIRLIGIRENGKEIIRLNKDANHLITSTSSKELQSKGHRDYFKEAIQEDPGQIYFSSIDLNKEYGKISIPFTPTLRVAAPLTDNQGNKAGLVIINVDVSPFFDRLRSIPEKNASIFLVDNFGQYLYHPNEYKQFSVQKGNDISYERDFNLSIDKLKLHQNPFFEIKDQSNSTFLQYFKPVHYYNDRRSVFIVSSIEKRQSLVSAHEIRRESLQLLFIVCISALLIILYFSWLFSRRINLLTQSIQEANPKDDQLETLTHRKDELGQLANTYKNLRIQLDNQMEALNQSLQKEKKAIQDKNEFLQNMTHDMRTPLQAIMGLTSLMMKNNPSTSHIPIIKNIQQSAQNLSGLMTDVLDHQKLIAGKVHFKYLPTRIDLLLKEIHSNYQYSALQKGLSFEYKISPALDNIFLLTDPLRLSQIITNLVMNAIKYTEEGTVMIHGDYQNDHLIVLISDSGIGIDEKHIDKINERFYQSPNILSEQSEGYGLGLSIVKQLVQMFKGKVTAKSNLDEGSEFCIEIPVKKVSNPIEHQKYDTITYLDLPEPVSILIIEDDKPTLSFICHALEPLKARLIQASTISDIKEKLFNEKYSLVISDLNIQHDNIFPLLNSYKDKFQNDIIIISALDENPLGKNYKFLQKPFTLESFQILVQYFLGKRLYKAPDFQNIYTNYDFQITKIIHVLDMLNKEIYQYRERIDHAFFTRDSAEWKAIRHKLIAHIKDLKLFDLDRILQKPLELINREELRRIQNILCFYQCSIMEEIRTNSII